MLAKIPNTNCFIVGVRQRRGSKQPIGADEVQIQKGPETFFSQEKKYWGHECHSKLEFSLNTAGALLHTP